MNKAKQSSARSISLALRPSPTVIGSFCLRMVTSFTRVTHVIAVNILLFKARDQKIKTHATTLCANFQSTTQRSRQTKIWSSTIWQSIAKRSGQKSLKRLKCTPLDNLMLTVPTGRLHHLWRSWSMFVKELSSSLGESLMLVLSRFRKAFSMVFSSLCSIGVLVVAITWLLSRT